MRSLRVALLVPLAVGCSILDPGDREELRHQIAMMPREKMTPFERCFMHERAKEWLESRDDRDQVGKIQCRDNESGVWSDWYDRPETVYTVADMKNCLLKKPNFPTYLFCIAEYKNWVVDDTEEQLKKLLREFTDVECKFVWDFRYEPEKVDPKMVDPDAITADDYIEAMITMPGPPPGLPLPQFAPLLCPLGAGPGWGCPPRPSDTIPTGGESTDPAGGDHR